MLLFFNNNQKLMTQFDIFLPIFITYFQKLVDLKSNASPHEDE